MAPSLDVFLAHAGPAVLVEISTVKGSCPRERGTFMLVSDHTIWETIGGGQFEYIAIDHARAMLRNGKESDSLDIPLGPEIGQCCGGRTLLSFTRVTPGVLVELQARLAQERDLRPGVYIFGAGHVGKAMAASFSLLPLAVTVIETRKSELEDLPSGVTPLLCAMPEAVVGEMAAGSAAVIVTHDHALDFLIAKESLARDDLAYTGMIGSSTKRATFSRWLLREGGDSAMLERLTLPVGGQTVRDKRPAVIAALVAAELLHAFAAHAGSSKETRPVPFPAGRDRA